MMEPMVPASSDGPVKLGPTFGVELQRAGLVNLPIAWTTDGTIIGRDRLTAEQNSKLDEVIAAHDPTKTMVPLVISHRQFYQVAAVKGMITQQEALEAVRHGTIPALMQQGLDTLPPDQKFAAEMMLSGANEFDRHHPMVEKFGEIMGFPGAVLDDMWRLAATL